MTCRNWDGIDYPTPADRQPRNSCHQRCCVYVGRYMSCRLLIGEGGGRSRRQGWCIELIMQCTPMWWRHGWRREDDIEETTKTTFNFKERIDVRIWATRRNCRLTPDYVTEKCRLPAIINDWCMSNGSVDGFCRLFRHCVKIFSDINF